VKITDHGNEGNSKMYEKEKQKIKFKKTSFISLKLSKCEKILEKKTGSGLIKVSRYVLKTSVYLNP